MPILITQNNKIFTITDEQYKKFYEILTNKNIPNSYEIVGEKNTIKKGDIFTLELDKKIPDTFYYKVRLSYSDDAEDVTVTKEELPNVMWAFVHDSKVVTTNGAFRGKDIISILPDFNRIMGWNKGYETTPEDHYLIQKNEKCLLARNYQNHVKELCYEVKTPLELAERSKQLLLK